MDIVIYGSQYETAKRYAEELANRTLMKMSKISIHMKLSFILGLCMPVELWA